MGIRPEHLMLQRDKPADLMGVTLKLRIQLVEFMGSEYLVYGLEEQGEHQRQIVARLEQDVGAVPVQGDVVEFFACKQYVQYFEKSTGNRLP
ncbi:MAG: TOBE domain-containing protein, partial [Gammaproteobacteria bacterium]|nr:TOBE domain-containing protein [Gammaproteobacteria bacterium]